MLARVAGLVAGSGRRLLLLVMLLAGCGRGCHTGSGQVLRVLLSMENPDSAPNIQSLRVGGCGLVVLTLVGGRRFFD